MTPMIVSASYFRNNLFSLYQDHLASDAKNPKPIQVVNSKTKSLMFDILPLENDEDKKKEKLRLFLARIEKGELRDPGYDEKFYKKMKAIDRAKSKKLIRGEYE